MTQLQNMGSIIKIEVAMAQNITIGKPNSSNQVSVVNSGSWDEIIFTMDTASFSDSSKSVSEGIMYKQKLAWKIPKVGPSNHAIAHAYDNKKVVLRVTDANGTVYILGSEKAPAYINVKSRIPTKPSGLNAYSLSVNYESPHPAYFVA